MNCIAVDTGSIIFGLENKIDVFQKINEEFPSYSIIIPSGVIGELEKIRKYRRKESIRARYALKIVERHSLEIRPSEGLVDDWLFENAPLMKCMVCTNDTKLRRRLRAKGVKVVSLSIGGSLR